MSIRAGDHATPLSVIPAQAGTTPPVETHIAHCRRLLEHAAELIAQGDRLQASEKLWGAAAHRIKGARAAAAGRTRPFRHFCAPLPSFLRRQEPTHTPHPPPQFIPPPFQVGG